MKNERVTITKSDGQTRLWIARTTPSLNSLPDMIWQRELSDSECRALLENPGQLFEKPEPNGKVRIVCAGGETDPC